MDPEDATRVPLESIKGEAIEIDGVGAFDHVVRCKHSSKQGRCGAGNGEGGFSVRIDHDRLVILQKPGFPLSDCRLDRRNGVGSKGDMVDGVEDDVRIHTVYLCARYHAEDASELATMEGDVGRGDVLAIE